MCIVCVCVCVCVHMRACVHACVSIYYLSLCAYLSLLYGLVSETV